MTTPQLAVGPLLGLTLSIPLVLLQLTLFAAGMYFFISAIIAYAPPRTATRTHPLLLAAASLLLTTGSIATAFFTATLLTNAFTTN